MTKILVVDTDQHFSDRYCEIVSRNFDFSECVVCSDPESALEECKTSYYDLIISEIQLGRTNGFEFKKELNKRNICSALMFITSLPINVNLLMARQVGALAFLSKPISEEELVSAIRSALEYTRICKPKAEYLNPVAYLEIENSIKTTKPLSEGYTIGRSDDCDIVLKGNTISRHHCLLSRVFDRVGIDYLLIDHSANSTQINGKKVRGYAELHDGDVIQISRYRLVYKKIKQVRFDTDDTDIGDG